MRLQVTLLENCDARNAASTSDLLSKNLIHLYVGLPIYKLSKLMTNNSQTGTCRSRLVRSRCFGLISMHHFVRASSKIRVDSPVGRNCLNVAGSYN